MYTADYEPPAPVIPIGLAVSGTNDALGPFVALIDTGSDVTVMPQTVLVSLRAKPVRTAYLRSPWGERRHAAVYVLDVLIGAERYPNIEIAADEAETEFILGRNFLNRLPLLLDGPQMTVQLLNAPALQRLREARSLE